MGGVTRNQVLEGLARYGYSFRHPAPRYAGEALLEQLVTQKDPRLLEAFPAVFLVLLEEKEVLEWELSGWTSSRKLSGAQRRRLMVLLALSYLLFELFGLNQTQLRRTAKALSSLSNWKKEVEMLRPSFQESGEVSLGEGVRLSVDRMKTQFRQYALLKPPAEAVQKRREELELELLLSEFFTPRQKELLSKRRAGEPFTKTEREYYYRVVRRRLKALADERLQQFAKVNLNKPPVASR